MSLISLYAREIKQWRVKTPFARVFFVVEEESGLHATFSWDDSREHSSE